MSLFVLAIIHLQYLYNSISYDEQTRFVGVIIEASGNDGEVAVYEDAKSGDDHHNVQLTLKSMWKKLLGGVFNSL